MECNQMKMREALVKIRDKCVIYNNDLAEEIDALCGNALSAPPRNCDAGTVKDQIRRFRKFCETEKCRRYRCGTGCKSTCIDRCAIAFAQMPYDADEKGESDEQK